MHTSTTCIDDSSLVMVPGLQMTAFLKAEGMTEAVLSVFRGVGAAAGVAATFSFPLMASSIGEHHSLYPCCARSTEDDCSIEDECSTEDDCVLHTGDLDTRHILGVCHCVLESREQAPSLSPLSYGLMDSFFKLANGIALLVLQVSFRQLLLSTHFWPHT